MTEAIGVGSPFPTRRQLREAQAPLAQVDSSAVQPSRPAAPRPHAVPRVGAHVGAVSADAVPPRRTSVPAHAATVAPSAGVPVTGPAVAPLPRPTPVPAHAATAAPVTAAPVAATPVTAPIAPHAVAPDHRTAAVPAHVPHVASPATRREGVPAPGPAAAPEDAAIAAPVAGPVPIAAPVAGPAPIAARVPGSTPSVVPAPRPEAAEPTPGRAVHSRSGHVGGSHVAPPRPLHASAGRQADRPGEAESPSSPFPARRSIHAHSVTVPVGEVAPAPADAAAGGRRHGVGRASLLVALTAMTVAIPVSGFVGPDSSVALPERAIGTPLGGTTWAGDAAAASPTTASGLSGSIAAASRTMVRAPLEATKCSAAQTAANGTRPVVVAPDVVWPLTKGSYEVTSPFSMRISPVTGQLLMHEGVDMSAPLGTPIHAVADGVVVELSADYRSGTYLRIKHTASDGSVYFSAYAHEYADDIKVTQGEHVKAGQVIGAVGSNGWSTGPHLHFEIRNASDTAIEPLGWMEKQGATYVGQGCG